MGKKSRMKAQRRIQREGNIEPNIPRLPPRSDEQEYKSQGPFDLFDNPMTRAAAEALSEQDKEKYKRIGESLYGTVDFENGENMDNIPLPMADAVAYLEAQLKSGLHPSMLESNEKTLLENVYGKEWYTKWGYVAGDLTEIITF
jgi:hypothetical protein